MTRRRIMKKISNFLSSHIAFLVWFGVAILVTLFLIFGKVSENGYITLNGKDAKIEDYTEKFIEDANAALFRITNEDKPTDEETTKKFEVKGLGSATTLDQVLARRLPDGDNDYGKGWQCSKYTGYLATGQREYSTSLPDYGPVNGKDVAKWLVNYYGWKYVDTPVAGAIGSGYFNTEYGHTVMYLYSTGSTTAMVNDANWTPLTVSTHNIGITGWVWVVPNTYSPEPTPEPSPTPTPVTADSYVVQRGDTLGGIVQKLHWCDGCKLFGNDGYTQKLAEYNGIPNRGLIYQGQVIRRK